MTIQCEERFAVHVDDYAGYDNKKIRNHFLIPRIFAMSEIQLTYTHYDRLIVGGAMPGQTPLKLEAVAQLRADYFLQRRELGIINVGGTGTVSVDGEVYELDYKEALYIGRGAKAVFFASGSGDKPAKFYLNSAPAHCHYPTRKVGRGDAEVIALGANATCNERVLNKLLVNSVLETCQLQMGMTELKPGSVWNTMPCHFHSRRMEAYFYFDVPADQAVCHFMGPAHETRHIWMSNEQAVVSPPWSIHSGAGTSHYSFIWGMAGENLDYGDMDHLSPAQLAGVE